jgi:hypothetical protein
MSAPGRKLPPTTRVSVSPMERTDTQIQVARVGFVPVTGTGRMKAGGNIRPKAAIDLVTKE